MICNFPALCRVLSAHHEVGTEDEAYNFLRFADPLLKYELTIGLKHNSVQLAVDPDKPIQGCPLLEYCFKCIEIEIGDSSYGPGPVVRFYEHRESQYGTRLTMIQHPDNRWYLWANGMSRPPVQEHEQLGGNAIRVLGCLEGPHGG